MILAVLDAEIIVGKIVAIVLGALETAPLLVVAAALEGVVEHVLDAVVTVEVVLAVVVVLVLEGVVEHALGVVATVEVVVVVVVVLVLVNVLELKSILHTEILHNKKMGKYFNNTFPFFFFKYFI